jgi:hypothetical protein
MSDFAAITTILLIPYLACVAVCADSIYSRLTLTRERELANWRKHGSEHWVRDPQTCVVIAFCGLVPVANIVAACGLLLLRAAWVAADNSTSRAVK